MLGGASYEETPSPDTADDDAPAKFWIAVQPTPLDDVAVPATEKPAAIPEDILDAIETEPAAKAKRAKSKSDKARMTKAGSGKSEPAAVGAPLQGVVARISGRLVEGWAQDPRNRETPVSLELVIEGICAELKLDYAALVPGSSFRGLRSVLTIWLRMSTLSRSEPMT